MIDPRFESALSWTSKTGPLINQYGSIPKLLDENMWQDWANYVCSLPIFAGTNMPRPQGFPTWQDWARRFNEAARLIGIQ